MRPSVNERRLRLNRNAPHAAVEFADDAGDGGLEFEKILQRFEQQEIRAALDQSARLLAVDIGKLLVR